VVVTKGPTRGDAETTHRIDAPLGVTLSALAELMSPPVMAVSD
jgi:hypothetical protein